MKVIIAFALITVCVVFIEEVRCSTEICYPIPRVVENQKGQGETGRPGKRGPAGPQGVKGEPGSCVCATEEFESLRSQLQTVQGQVRRLNEQHAHVDLDAHCFAGLKNGDIPDTAITASSVYNNNAGHRPRYGRLDLRSEYTNSIGSWVAGRQVPGEWIQVDFGRPQHLTGVITQGRGHAVRQQQWVTSFKIGFSDDGTTFRNMKNAGGADQAELTLKKLFKKEELNRPIPTVLCGAANINNLRKQKTMYPLTSNPDPTQIAPSCACLQFGVKAKKLIRVKYDEKQGVFQGNFDTNTYKINMFPQPITARYVRLVVVTLHSHIAMRMEYLIC